MATVTKRNYLPIEIRVRGTCRGCNPDKIKLYSVPTSNSSAPKTQGRTTGRQLSASDSATFFESSRQLVELQQCYCDVQAIGERAPYESEFVTALKKSLGSLDLNSIGPVPSYQFGTVFPTGVILSLSQDQLSASGNLTEALAKQFKSTVNNLYRVTGNVCNTEFR